MRLSGVLLATALVAAAWGASNAEAQVLSGAEWRPSKAEREQRSVSEDLALLEQSVRHVVMIGGGQRLTSNQFTLAWRELLDTATIDVSHAAESCLKARQFDVALILQGRVVQSLTRVEACLHAPRPELELFEQSVAGGADLLTPVCETMAAAIEREKPSRWQKIKLRRAPEETRLLIERVLPSWEAFVESLEDDDLTAAWERTLKDASALAKRKKSSYLSEPTLAAARTLLGSINALRSRLEAMIRESSRDDQAPEPRPEADQPHEWREIMGQARAIRDRQRALSARVRQLSEESEVERR